MTAALIEELAADETAVGIVPITVDQYHKMIRTGIIPDGSPIELIDGVLLWKDRSSSKGDPMGHDPRHALLIMRALQLLQHWVAGIGCHMRVQLPLALTKVNEPEPDIAIIQGNVDDFATRHPGPADVLMTMEIADSSIRRDRSTKQRLYAEAGIANYWIVNLRLNQVEVYEEPDPERSLYAKSTVHKPGETLMLRLKEQAFPIDLSRLLG